MLKTRYRIGLRIAAVVAVAFGLLTVREGGAVLFGGEAARAAAGNYVPFVLWFNFLAGFAYVAAGAGLWLQQRWSAWLALAILIGTVAVFAAFGVHVAAGGGVRAAYGDRDGAAHPRVGRDFCGGLSQCVAARIPLGQMILEKAVVRRFRRLTQILGMARNAGADGVQAGRPVRYAATVTMSGG